MILTDKISANDLFDKIARIAEQLQGYTNKLVFSFADIGVYRKVGRNLTDTGVHYREWTNDEMIEFARRLSELNLGFELAVC